MTCCTYIIVNNARSVPGSRFVGDEKLSIVLAGVPEDGKEVTGGSRGHKQVPDEVAVSDPLGEVERDSRGVGEPAGCDPEQPFQG